MCEIFFQYSKSGRINTQALVSLLFTAVREASHNNSDGFGVFNEEKQVLKSSDKLEYDHINRIVEEFKGSKFVVIHLRMATQGEVAKRNSHPFKHRENVLVHNGSVDTPKRFEKGRADSYQLLREIHRRKDGDTVQAIRDSLRKTSGSVSVFLHDYKDDLYYFRDTSDFTFGEIEETGEIVGATRRRRLHSAFPNTRLELFTPSEQEIYKITDEGVVKADRFEMKTLYRGGTDSVYGHGRRVTGETDYEKWRKKRRNEELEEFWKK
ncbi:class II glutamine amidotransferase [Haloarcula japonica]|uniref:class II glutamine amidotransferase n=1 Tax=Haloarcula japonica TaxID=29282 RepID=UPI0039F6648A